MLVIPATAISCQALRRWPYRAGWSAVLAIYAAQVVQLGLTTWAFRFCAAFALFIAAAFMWGLRTDEVD